MNGERDLVPRRDVDEIVDRERARERARRGKFLALVIQDAALLDRSESEGFDPLRSIRLAVTSDTGDDGKPVLACVGSAEELPDEIFPQLTKGYTVRYQVAAPAPTIEAGNFPDARGAGPGSDGLRGRCLRWPRR